MSAKLDREKKREFGVLKYNFFLSRGGKVGADMLLVGLEGAWYGMAKLTKRGGAQVTRQIPNPHDKLFKQILGEPENAADFVANNLLGSGFGVDV